MDPKSFLYIALGVGFLLFVIFVCVTLIYVMQILRDVNKITGRVKDTAERVNDYIIQPFAVVNSVIEHIKPMIEAVQRKRSEVEGAINDKIHQSAKNYRKNSKK